MRYSLVITLAVAIGALATPHTHYLVKRAQTFACSGALKLPLRTEPGPPAGDRSKEVGQQTCLDVNNGHAPHYTYHDGDPEAKLVTATSIPAGTTCEHILEIQMLKMVLESRGGPCDQIKNAKPDEHQAIRVKFKQITDIINSAPNLVFADNVFEQQKGDMVSKSQSGKKYFEKKGKPGKPNLKIRLIAVDHFVNTQTKALALKVAGDLDAKIAELFPGTTAHVVDKWNDVLAFAHTAYDQLEDPPCSSVAKRDLTACTPDKKTPSKPTKSGTPPKKTPPTKSSPPPKKASPPPKKKGGKKSG